MSEGLTRREVMGASALLMASRAIAAPIEQSPRVVAGRRRDRLGHWKFHLGHAADIELDFGFGRDQRTFAKAGTAAQAAMTKFDDSSWSRVVVPHDWAAGLPFAQPEARPAKDRADSMAAHGFKAIGREFPQNSIGWYRTE